MALSDRHFIPNLVSGRDLLDGVIFQDLEHQNADFRTFVWRCDHFPQQTVSFAELIRHQKIPQSQKNLICTLITFRQILTMHGNTQNQEKWPQGLDLGRSTASNQAIANLRPQP